MKNILIISLWGVLFAIMVAETQVIYSNDFAIQDELRVAKKHAGVKADVKSDKNGLRLNYELPENNDNIVLQLPVKIEIMPEKAEISLVGDSSMNLLILRLIDANGETHQYRSIQLKEGEQMAEIDFTNFSNKRISIHGGDRNRKLDLPIKGIGVEIRNASKYWPCKPQGEIILKSLQLKSRSAAVETISGALNSDIPILVATPKTDATLTRPVIINSGGEVSAIVSATFDEQYLYFKINVTDPTFNCPYKDTAIYENDAIELFFDCRRNSTLQLNQSDDYQIVATPATGGKGPPRLRVYRNSQNAYIYADSTITAECTDNGYQMFLKLPIDAFDGMRNSAQAIGFGMNLVDNNGTVRKKLHWAGTTPLKYGLLTFGNLSESQMDMLRMERRKHLALLQPSGSDPMNNSYRGVPAIHETRILTSAPRRYHKFETQIKLDAEYDNPFDFDAVNLAAVFTAPDGTTTKVDGFLDQPHAISFNHKIVGDKISVAGDLRWLIRFAPKQTGSYSCKVFLKDRQGRKAEAPQFSFSVMESDNPGFLQVSPHDYHYLSFNNGDSFFGIGFAGHFWQKTNVVLYTKHYLNQLAAFGGNYTSVNLEVIGNGGFNLETDKAGQYNLKNASCFDYVLECAERRGVYLIPCLMQTALGIANNWGRNVYSTSRGGPCQKVDEYFTSPEVRKLIKNRLRYLIARWGYSTAILGFEIFNEVNYTDGFKKDSASVVEFHSDIAAYLKQIDPNQHLVSTCFGSGAALELPAIWQLPEIDFVVTHSYANDIAGELFKRLENKRQYGKPNIGGENGIPASVCTKAREVDPNGLAIHNNLWASMIGGSAGNVLQWWYAHYADPLDLYAIHYPPFVKFIRDIKFDQEKFIPDSGVVYDINQGGDNALVKNFKFNRQWNNLTGNNFILKSDGVWREIPLAEATATIRYVADMDRLIKEDTLPGLMHAKTKYQWEVILPQAGSAVLTLAATGINGAGLTIKVNGKAVVEKHIMDIDGRNNPEANELTDRFDLPLQKGKNHIEITNSGPDFVVLRSLSIANLSQHGILENLRVNTLKGPKLILAWIQDTANTWYRQNRGEELKSIKQAAFELAELNGTWKLEWFDTWSGKIIKTETIDFDNDRKLIEIPEFSRDLALKMHKQN